MNLHAWGVQTFMGLFSIDGYISLGGERIWVKVKDGYVVKAEAPPRLGAPPDSNRKWIATETLAPFLDWGGRTQPKP